MTKKKIIPGSFYNIWLSDLPLGSVLDLLCGRLNGLECRLQVTWPFYAWHSKSLEAKSLGEIPDYLSEIPGYLHEIFWVSKIVDCTLYHLKYIYMIFYSIVWNLYAKGSHNYINQTINYARGISDSNLSASQRLIDGGPPWCRIKWRHNSVHVDVWRSHR